MQLWLNFPHGWIVWCSIIGSNMILINKIWLRISHVLQDFFQNLAMHHDLIIRSNYESVMFLKTFFQNLAMQQKMRILEAKAPPPGQIPVQFDLLSHGQARACRAAVEPGLPKAQTHLNSNSSYGFLQQQHLPVMTGESHRLASNTLATVLGMTQWQLGLYFILLQHSADHFNTAPLTRHWSFGTLEFNSPSSHCLKKNTTCVLWWGWCMSSSSVFPKMFIPTWRHAPTAAATYMCQHHHVKTTALRARDKDSTAGSRWCSSGVFRIWMDAGSKGHRGKLWYTSIDKVLTEQPRASTSST